ncbi:MAG TPA: M20/M25/M40 family metallo-hydrolase [Kofleriaceae bacterium]|nr:M20/M25/M40 family metallo-hydrolase [Kofleriaceae bacterium]
MTTRTKPLVVFAVLVVLGGLELVRLGNPDPAPADAPADQFSAARAIATLHAVSLDAPHAIATPAHDVVRDRIAAALRALDYQVEIEHAFACNAGASCGEVDNVIARRPDPPVGNAGAKAAAKAVIIAAHYDSVPAGPGASDDGTGVATALEIARAIRHEALANPVVFLLDDGEEAGLLGAEGYLADAGRSRAAAFVINLEARGTTGTPFLFETSREQRWLVPIIAHALPHPVTTSLFATIYDLLPNDTDLTVFKRAGRAGINFANVGGGTQYHTPLDNFANVDAGGVQRRGDQVLAMVRAFDAVPLDAAALAEAPGAVWFDVFAAFVVWWPAGWTAWIAIAALVVLGGAVVRGRRRGPDRAVTLGGVALGIAAFAGTLVLAAVLGAALLELLGLRAPGAMFAPYPQPMLGAAWLLGLVAALVATGLARRRAAFDSVMIGHGVAWNAVALVLAARLPGAAYLALAPGAVIAVVAAVRQLARLPEAAASVIALAGAATVFLPFVMVGYDALGAAIAPGVTVMVALIGTTFAPLIADTSRRLALGGFAGAAVLAVLALVVPGQSASHPPQLALAHVTDADTSAARWEAAAPPPIVRAVARFAAERAVVAPWFGPRGTTDVAPAPAVAVAAPQVTIAPAVAGADGTRMIALDVASQRQAPRLAIAWRSDAETVAVRVNGVALPPRPARLHSYLAPGWNRILIRGSSAHVELTVRGAGAAEARIRDTSFGLPPVGAALALARDVSGAVTVQDGDVTVVERHVTW